MDKTHGTATGKGETITVYGRLCHCGWSLWRKNMNRVRNTPIVYIILLILLVGCSEQAPQRIQLSTLEKDARLFCPVVINGHTFNFVLDTGSDQTLINYPKALEAGLSPTDSCLQTIGLIDRTWKDSVYKSEFCLEIGNISFPSEILVDNYRTHIFDYKNFDGILGMNVLSQINWTIDLKKNELLLHPYKKNLLNEGMIPDLTFEAVNNLFYMNMNLGGLTQKVVLDTGCLMALRLNDYEFLPDLALTNDLFNQCKKDTARMVYMEIENKLLMVYDNLEIGKINLPYALMNNEMQNDFFNSDALLTKSFLDHFDYMVHDTQKEQIYLCGYNSHIARTEEMGKIHSKIREGYQKGTLSIEILKK